HLDLDLEKLAANVRSMNPHVTIIPVSAKTGEGLEAWFSWVKSQVKATATISI
ncbi:MAG: hydrogenase accessory protein HypB, partial [Cyanobacteriota bacterium]